jgi:Transposase DDE domain
MSDSPTFPGQSQELADQLASFVAPLLQWLDSQVDKRLVRTFLLALQAILMLRHTRYGLLLSELGGYILNGAQAPAGTKRLSNLLRSPKWTYSLIERFLGYQSQEHLDALIAEGKTALVIWDESVIEKPESIALEGLGPVRSSKAARLKRIKPGYFHPPGGPPVFVPGMQWISLVVSGLEGVPTLAAMRWWTNRGPRHSDQRTEEAELLGQCTQRWGQKVVHVWDRGFASAPWLGCALEQQVRFILRWPSRLKLVDETGHRNAWRITQGQRSQDHREIWDARRRCFRKTGIVVVSVTHLQYDQPLWLVVSRPGKGRQPWYLLTNEPITSLEEAWRIVFAYARRWQIEMSYRYSKTELAMESPRLWCWERRLKLLFLATLAYAFLLSLLKSACPQLVERLLRNWCHRTGKRYRHFAIPLYRLRSALSHLWLTYRPSLTFPAQNLG